MSLKRIRAILLHEYFIISHSFEVINDIILYPLMSIIVFGFMTVYIAGTGGQVIARHVLIGMILWQVVNITQYSIAVGCLWDVWARNLTNIFISPISTNEYFFSYALSGIIKAAFVIFLGSSLSYFVFHFNILSLGLFNLILFFINLAFFAFSFSIVVLSLIFRFGTRIQAFAWGLITIFQPLMAVIYPVSVLPEPFRSLAYIFPPTYVFEAARKSLDNSSIQIKEFGLALITNIIFCIIAFVFFKYMFKRSKELGNFARLEG